MSLKKSDAGYELYKAGWTHSQIAELLDVSTRTVDNWKKHENWAEKRKKEILRETNTTDMVWKLYTWNLEVLQKRVDKWRESESDEMISKGDVDALQKFYVQVKDKSVAWNVYVKVCRELVAYLAQERMDVAKILEDTKLVDDFLNLKRGEV